MIYFPAVIFTTTIAIYQRTFANIVYANTTYQSYPKHFNRRKYFVHFVAIFRAEKEALNFLSIYLTLGGWGVVDAGA